MTDIVFLFGTLRHDPLRAAVLGGQARAVPGLLPGFRCARQDGYPRLIAKPGHAAEGILLWPDTAQLARLDLYEALFGYSRKPAQDAAGRAVWVYCPASGPDDAPDLPDWSLHTWADRLGAAATLASAEIMALARSHDAADLALRYPMLLAHAASRLRARAEAVPHSLRRAAGHDDVAPVATLHPYAQFFGVQADDLRFRRFDGSYSEVVRRAGFVMSDAVTLLPYDPVRDRVMLVEQFRYGLYLRDVANCWSLEAIAGRIDGGEQPEDAAIREAQEEAGLSLRADMLRFIGQSYPSPGAISECLFQYVALCDLPENDGAVGGLASEAEDIRRHVIGFGQLMQLVENGEIQNGPLQTSAYWLALNRTALRA